MGDDRPGYHWGKAAGVDIRLAAENPSDDEARVIPQAETDGSLNSSSPARSSLSMNDWGRVIVHRTWIAVTRVMRGARSLIKS